jgi:hypothetical protein
MKPGQLNGPITHVTPFSNTYSKDTMRAVPTQRDAGTRIPTAGGGIGIGNPVKPGGTPDYPGGDK